MVGQVQHNEMLALRSPVLRLCQHCGHGVAWAQLDIDGADVVPQMVEASISGVDDTVDTASIALHGCCCGAVSPGGPIMSLGKALKTHCTASCRWVAVNTDDVDIDDTAGIVRYGTARWP